LSADAAEVGCQCVKKAVELALAGEIDFICTASLNKTAIRMAGYAVNGHAGLLSLYTGVKKSYAVLACPKLSVVHVSTHVSVAKATELCRTERVLDTIRAAHRHALMTGIERPRVHIRFEGGQQGLDRPGIATRDASGAANLPAN